MLFLPTAWACETGLSSKTGIPRFWDSVVPVSGRTGEDTICSSTPSMGKRNKYQFQGAALAPSTSQTGHVGHGQSVGRGRPQDLQAESSGQAGQMTCYHCH